MSKIIREYDENNNLIHIKNSDGYEEWYEYNENGNEIHHKNSNGNEYWKEYDENSNMIHFKNSNGFETWHDENNNIIHCKFSNNYECWYEYDENNNEIHSKNSYGFEEWYAYDENGDKIIFKSYDAYKIFLSKVDIKEPVKDIINTNPLIKNICQNDNGCFKNIILPAIINSSGNTLEVIVHMLATYSIIYDKLLNNIAQYGSKELIEKSDEDLKNILINNDSDIKS